ncbi:hypothetical protein LLE67_19795 [Xanthomonas campestris]|uniref:hypothetical protein n=1 Tax=Xanthomonas campestris TaxID=339 RepID=UPI001E34E330|nr:hypothetical protein [Xanthomonas campestris]MCC5070049.1 hypothetical protein [Xanthomonas campestris]
MKLTAARECYYSHSGNASAAARQIAFAGIAVVWVFNRPLADKKLNLPDELVIVLLMLCIALACDLLQYSSSAALWGYWSRRKEKELQREFHNDPDIEPPYFINWPGIAMFWSKLALLFCAYLWLGLYMKAMLGK